jgi:hypothetical protein
MPIDYSQPEWGALFKNYGLTAHAAQVLEKMLLFLLGGVECREQGKSLDADLVAFLTTHKRMPVSQVIKALQRKMPAFPPGLDTDLLNVFDERNDVIHHFFLDRFDGEDWARPPTQMDQELRPIYLRLKRLQDSVEALLDQIQREVV